MANIGIVGKLGSGKTTVSDYLIDNFSYQRRSFATPLKWIAKEFFNVVDKKDPRARKLYQEIGTEWFRSEDPDVWVKYLLKKVGRKDRIVVDDVRFVNEASALLDKGWILIYLNCPEDLREWRCTYRDTTFDPSLLNHPSETQVDEVVKQFGSDLYFITIDASLPIKRVLHEVESQLLKYGVHSDSEIKVWYKRTSKEATAWMKQFGQNVLRGIKKRWLKLKSRQSWTTKTLGM